MSITLPRFDIEVMKPKHIEGCVRLDTQLFPGDCYYETDFNKFIRANKCVIPVVATSSGSVMGFHVMMIRAKNVFGIRTVVNPQMRGLGAGTAMMEYMHKVGHRKPCMYMIQDDPEDTGFHYKQLFLRHCGYRLARVDKANLPYATYLFRREPECSRKNN